MSTKNWEISTPEHKICLWVNQDGGVQGSLRNTESPALHRIYLNKSDAKFLGEMLIAASKESSDE